MYILVSLLLYCTLPSTEPTSPELEITIENIKDQQGTFIIAIFDSKENYLKKAHTKKTVTVSGESIQLIKIPLKEGEYAVAIIHDQNGNDKLDTNFLGIPKEAFGFSNKSLGLFGRPSFEETKFTQTHEGTKLTIKLVNL